MFPKFSMWGVYASIQTHLMVLHQQIAPKHHADLAFFIVVFIIFIHPSIQVCKLNGIDGHLLNFKKRPLRIFLMLESNVKSGWYTWSDQKLILILNSHFHPNPHSGQSSGQAVLGVGMLSFDSSRWSPFSVPSRSWFKLSYLETSPSASNFSFYTVASPPRLNKCILKWNMPPNIYMLSNLI